MRGCPAASQPEMMPLLAARRWRCCVGGKPKEWNVSRVCAAEQACLLRGASKAPLYRPVLCKINPTLPYAVSYQILTRSYCNASHTPHTPGVPFRQVQQLALYMFALPVPEGNVNFLPHRWLRRCGWR